MRLTKVSVGKLYRGLAVLAVIEILNGGATVEDARSYYLGHADIHHGIVPEQDEPLPAQLLKRYRDRIRAWAKTARYYPDRQPSSYRWDGGNLVP